MKSPLRYPGGKSRAIKSILPLIPKNIKEIVSPFVGGASIELALASKGINVFAYDNFDPLICFWNAVLNNRIELSNLIRQYHPLSKNDFYRMQKEIVTISDPLMKAVYFFIINRCSFSGTTFSGGMSPSHPRFNLASINRVRDLKLKNIQFDCLSFENSLVKHPNTFSYLDPPYFIKQNLYGIKGNMHKNFNHEKLYSILEKRKGWILSYNKCPEILELYKNYEIKDLNWIYGMSKEKQSNEIIIINH